MMTEFIKINPDRPSLSAIKKAAQTIKTGGLVILPTDTVYGLACDATNIQAVNKIFAVKQRPLSQPLSIAIGKPAQIRKYVKKYPDYAKTLVKKLLPGALTLILEKSDVIPDIVTAGRADIGIRIPDSKIVLMLMEYAKKPIVIPSANIHNRPSPKTAQQAYKDLKGKVDLIIDAGETRHGQESTIVSCLEKKIEIIRHGAIPDSEVFKAVFTTKE